MGIAALALALAGCSGSDDAPPEPEAGVVGPLCAALPSGADPGAPAAPTCSAPPA